MSSPQTIEIPDSLPVMVLPCTLFPHCLMPLYIFEPRYRAMLAQALSTDRMFCIGTCDSGDPGANVAPISTAGLVRACVTHANGTSHLILLGLRRIRLTDWLETTPFRVARVEPLACEMENPKLADRIAEEAIDMVGELTGPSQAMSAKIYDHLRQLNDPSAVADVIAHNFVTDPAQRQQLLETLDVVERLHHLSQVIQTRIADQS